MQHSNKNRAFSDATEDGIPTRKISETLLDFAGPFQMAVPEDVTPEKLESLLTVPITIWNGVILEELGEKPGLLEHARALAESVPFTVPFVDMLIERKRRYFGDDYRLIGRHRVRRAPDGSLKVQVEARWRGRPGSSRGAHS